MCPLPPAFGEEPERRERPVAVPGILKPYISVTRNVQKLHLLGPTGNFSVHRNERYIAAEGLHNAAAGEEVARTRNRRLFVVPFRAIIPSFDAPCGSDGRCETR